MKKKNLLLLVLTTGLLLAGCSRNTSSSQNTSTTSESTSNVSTEVNTSSGSIDEVSSSNPTSESSSENSSLDVVSSSISSVDSTSSSRPTSESSSLNSSSVDISSSVSSVDSISSSTNENAVNQEEWNTTLASLLKTTVSQKITTIPYLQNTECEYGEDTEYDETVYIVAVSDNTTYNGYLSTLNSNYSLVETFEDDYGDTNYIYSLFEETDHIYLQIVGYEEDGKFNVIIYVYHEEPPVIKDQKEFTQDDINTIKSIVSDKITTIPFMECYDYIVEEDITADNSACISYYTIKEKYTAFIQTLTNTYGDPVIDKDEENNTWYTFTISEEDNLYIEMVGVEEDGAFYVNFYVYVGEDSSSGGGEDISVEGITINADSFKGLPSGTYQSSTKSYIVDNITYILTKNIMKTNSEGYKDYGALQIKKTEKGTTPSIRNNTSLPKATNKVVVEIYSILDASTTKLLTLYGSNTTIGENEKTSNKANANIISSVNTGTKNNNKNIIKHTVEYTFSSEFSYFRLANENTNALYVGNIIFTQNNEGGSGTGGETGGSDVEVDPTKDISFTTQTINNVTKLGDYKDGMPTTGNVKVLVLPVDFSDFTAESKNYTIEKLEKAFNGTKGDTDYQSLHDYFYTSSYGKLDLNFDIYTEWLRADKPFTYYENTTGTDVWGETGNDSYATGEQLLLHELLQKLEAKGVDLKDYDSDNNGSIDSIVLINTAPIDQDKDLRWAYRYWNVLADTSTIDNDVYYYANNSVYANDYLWASYQFLHEGLELNGNFNNTELINTYTFIHEFSHVLGSEDYYNYATGGVNPLDGYDVMDNSIADHNAFTKMELGWVTDSKLITANKETTLTLKKFTETGETYIISNSYDESKGVFQEYWVLQYYSNDGLNVGSDKTNFGLFSNNGLLIYHVDASISTIQEDDNYYRLLNSNTDETEEGGSEDNLIEFVKNGQKIIYSAGDKTISNIVDNNGKKIPYIIEVVSVSDTEITIKITPNK